MYNLLFLVINNFLSTKKFAKKRTNFFKIMYYNQKMGILYLDGVEGPAFAGFLLVGALEWFESESGRHWSLEAERPAAMSWRSVIAPSSSSLFAPAWLTASAFSSAPDSSAVEATPAALRLWSRMLNALLHLFYLGSAQDLGISSSADVNIFTSKKKSKLFLHFLIFTYKIVLYITLYFSHQ